MWETSLYLAEINFEHTTTETTLMHPDPDGGKVLV